MRNKKFQYKNTSGRDLYNVILQSAMKYIEYFGYSSQILLKNIYF